MTLQKPKVIIFDWDNTLAKTRPATVESLNRTLAHYGKEDWETTKKKHRDHNKSLKENFPNFFGDQYKEAYDMYVNTYLDVYSDLLEAMPHARDVMSRLNDVDDIHLMIISNKEKKLLELEKDCLYGDINFCKVMGNGDSAENKPSASPVIAAMTGMGVEINPTNVWLVGDSNQDIDCACNAGCLPILVGNGLLAKKEYFEDKKKNSNMIHCENGFKDLGVMLDPFVY